MSALMSPSSALSATWVSSTILTSRGAKGGASAMEAVTVTAAATDTAVVRSGGTALCVPFEYDDVWVGGYTVQRCKGLAEKKHKACEAFCHGYVDYLRPQLDPYRML